jgi:hypothetical protein
MITASCLLENSKIYLKRELVMQAIIESQLHVEMVFSVRGKMGAYDGSDRIEVNRV